MCAGAGEGLPATRSGSIARAKTKCFLTSAGHIPAHLPSCRCAKSLLISLFRLAAATRFITEETAAELD